MGACGVLLAGGVLEFGAVVLLGCDVSLGAAVFGPPVVFDVEGALMKLSDTIVATYFTPHERFEGAREALA